MLLMDSLLRGTAGLMEAPCLSPLAERTCWMGGSGGSGLGGGRAGEVGGVKGAGGGGEGGGGGGDAGLPTHTMGDGGGRDGEGGGEAAGGRPAEDAHGSSSWCSDRVASGLACTPGVPRGLAILAVALQLPCIPGFKCPPFLAPDVSASEASASAPPRPHAWS